MPFPTAALQRVKGPRAQRQTDGFYGWWMVGCCTLAMIMTTPGQSIGISTFTNHFIESLGVSRTNVTVAYLIGTMSAATLAPAVGRRVDRHGVRRSMLVVGFLLSAAAMAMGGVQGIIGLTIGFFFVRLLGQGALSLTANTGIAVWFEERVGRAVAVSMSISQAIMAFAPLAITGLIALVGWRKGFVVLGLITLTVVPALAWFGVVDRPRTLGQLPDGATPQRTLDGTEPRQVGFVRSTKPARLSLNRSQALRTRAFWLLSLLLGLESAIYTGIVFHNVSIMEANGLSETQAAVLFIPTFATSLLATFVIGELADRIHHRILFLVAGALMAAGFVLVTLVQPGIMMLIYALVLGAQAGTGRVLSGAMYPKFFGSDHIGAIRGAAFLIGGTASGIGPLVVSLGRDFTGSYDAVMLGSAVAALLLAALAATIVDPRPISTGGDSDGDSVQHSVA